MKLNENVIREEERAVFELRDLYSSYGYRQYRMSKFEEYDLYARNKDFLVSNEIITFTDTSGKLLALKPDVTLSIIKNSKDCGDAVQKVYYNENVYRISKGTGDFKEIMQTGLECIGNIGIREIAETLLLAVKSLACISENYVLDISCLPIIQAIISNLGLERKAVDIVLECLGNKNSDGLRALCAEYAVESEAVCRLCELYGSYDSVRQDIFALCDSPEFKSAFSDLDAVCSVLNDLGYSDHVNIDFSIINDMNYYNGFVFKGYIDGLPASVLSGGQYDNLMLKMGRRDSGVGFAVYLDLLQRFGSKPEKYDVDVVLLTGKDTPVGDVFKACEEIIGEGKSVLATAKIPDNIKYRCTQVIGKIEGGTSK